MSAILFVEQNDTISFPFYHFFEERRDVVTDVNIVSVKKFWQRDFVFTKNYFATFLEINDNISHFEIFKKIVTSYVELGNIYLVLNSKNLSGERLDTVVTLCQQKNNLAGIIDLAVKKEIYTPLFNSLFKKMVDQENQDDNSLDLKEANRELLQMQELMVKELGRLKKLHAKIVPGRREHFHGIDVAGKYLAGESNGGDFFDMYKNRNKLLLILSSCSSYVASNILLNQTPEEYLKQNMSLERMQSFLKVIRKKMLEGEIDFNSEQVNVSLALFDFKTFTLEGFSLGANKIISDEQKDVIENIGSFLNDDIQQGHFKANLKQGERILFLSAGVMKNLINLEFLNNLFKSKDILNDLFFQLYSEKKGDFLAHDASAIYLKVDQNAMFEV